MDNNDFKTIQIADTIHGLIQLSHLEKEVISTQSFNRLHNILQNSTAYLTYPANNTKRFEHSIGTMYLSGELFYHSFINAEKDLQNEFMEQVDESIKKELENDDLIDKFRFSIGDSYLDMIEDGQFKDIHINEPLYDNYLPTCINGKHKYAFVLLFQSIRLSGLLHDLGHPPFSHITEFALEDVWDKIKEKDNRTSREKIFIKATEPYFKDEEHKLHEIIGNKIVSRMIKSLIKDISNDYDAKYCYFKWLVGIFVDNILNDKPGIFKDVHRLIDGSIDADRLDYVSRDMWNSGFDVGKIEYDRLISSIKLMKENESDTGNINIDYLFCFRLKTINTIEDFFQRRIRLYKHILYHHRVAKTDELLRQSIIKLSKDYLETTNNEEDNQTDNDVLSVEISGLWEAVKKVYSNERYFNALIQWDDAWLISVLKRGFFAKYYNSEDTVKFKLEEFLSNKKYYNSVIKRMDDFYILDKEVAEELSRKNYLDILRNINQVHQDIIDAMEEIINDYNENKIPDNGFLLYKFEQLFEAIDPDSEVLNIIIKSTVDKVVSSYGDKIIDYLVVSKKLKTGLEKMPYVYKGQKIFLLKKYSNIYIELERKRKLFPFFFIYIYNKKYIDFEEFLIKVGSELIKNILKTFNELN